MPGMSEHSPRSISITLSPAQIDDVVRAAADSRAPSLVTVIADSLNAPRAEHGAGAPHASHGIGAQVEVTGDNGEAAARSGERRRARAASHGYAPPETGDQRLSRSLLRGLSILTRFGPDGEARGIVELAGELGMSPSTAHRYALTLVELGLLERCPKTRKYRLPGTAD